MKMVMKRRTTVLLMLSLIVVLVGSIAADAADGVDDQAIRLPSDGDGKGFADDATAAAAAIHGGNKKERPWECCDLAACTKSIPPICQCTDVVQKCAAACKDCEEVPSSPGRYVCRDIYTGWPGPTCTGTN